MCGPECFMTSEEVDAFIERDSKRADELFEEALAEEHAKKKALTTTQRKMMPLMTPNVEEDIYSRYEPLLDVLAKAFDRAAFGKGAKRHADGKAFDEQPIIKICEGIGSADGCLFQAVKKIYEIKNLNREAAQQELLDAIVYIAAAYIYREKSYENNND